MSDSDPTEAPSDRTGPAPAPDAVPRQGHGHGPDRPAGRRIRWLLAAGVVPLLLATLLGLVALWPSGTTPGDISLDGLGGTPGAAFPVGTVTGLDTSGCADGGACTAQVSLDDPPQDGPATGTVQLDPQIADVVDVGDRLRLVSVDAGGEQILSFVDFERTVPIAVLALLYAVVVVAVARWRGLRALLGLGFGYLVLVRFMLPALLEGGPPAAIALVGSGAIMLVVLYAAHGLSARTTTALLGTAAGLLVTTALAVWATPAAHLTGTGGEDALTLQQAPALDLASVVLVGMVVAGLGVLNDVTITQASAVWELHDADPTASRRTLFGRAMRIGRDHIASTVYTIAFAYAGAMLPTLLLVLLYRRPFGQSLTSGDLAEEVVRVLVGSIGLVLAIPLTTAVAVAVRRAGPDAVQEPRSTQQAR